MGGAVKKTFKVGEAPWEKAEKKSFKVGEAPWEKEEPGIGSKVLDAGMSALDYLGGMGRFAASGYADLYNLATDQPLLNKPDTGLDVLKGQAPTSSEYLERSGMEPGFKREAIGLASDIALDPVTYSSGGLSTVGKFKKLKQLYNVASAPARFADKATGKVAEKTVGKLYNTVAKQIAPKMAETFSGASEHALREYASNKEAVQRIGKDKGKFVDEFAAQVDEAMAARAKDIGQKIENLGMADPKVNIAPIKQTLKSKIDDIELKAVEKGGLSSEDLDKLTTLKETYSDAFMLKDVDGSVIGEMSDIVNLPDATQLKRMISETGSGKKTVFDVKGNERALKKMEAGTMKDLYGKINKSIDDAYGPTAKDLRDEYSVLLKDKNIVEKNITNIDPRTGLPKAFDTLADYGKRTKSGEKLGIGLDNLEDNLAQYGQNINMRKQAGQLQAANQMLDPSWLPISGQGVVSTGRIALTSAAGAALANQAGGDTRTGAALGLGLGSILSSPAMMRRTLRTGRNVEKMFTPAVQPSTWRRMSINEFQKDKEK